MRKEVKAKYITEEDKRWEAKCPFCGEECWIMDYGGRWHLEDNYCEHWKEQKDDIFIFEK